MFVGQLKCTDGDRNIILALTQEYRPPSQKAIERAAKESDGKGSVKVDMQKRFVGLIVVPGQYIKRIEVEEETSRGW